MSFNHPDAQELECRDGARVPPTWQARIIENAVRGPFWRAFIGAANRAILSSDPELRVTSWHRTKAVNRACGGHPESQHLVGAAIDVVPSRGKWAEVETAFRAEGFVVVRESDHIHVQAWPAGTLRTSGLLGIVV